MARGESNSFEIGKRYRQERSWRLNLKCAVLHPRRKTIPLCLLILSSFATAELQTSRTYTTADGLPSNMVTCNRQDTHGFLWFCTAEGLSRFDGYTFTNYGVDQGLPDRYVTDFLETRSGDYWVGTARGLAHSHHRLGAKTPMFTFGWLRL